MVTKNYCMEYAENILNGKIVPFDHCEKIGWKRYAEKFNKFLDTGIPEFSIFAMKGNSKLKFVAYSTLPKFNCPGAGECLNFCYSFKAWRYPAAFFRQLQNTILERYAPEHIKQSVLKLKHGVTLRLYVDGDINAHNIEFWKTQLSNRSDLQVYGYSKSLELIIAHSENWPKNWLLNLSSGHNASDQVAQEYARLPFVRGEFIAHTGEGKTGYDRAKNAAKNYKEKTGKKMVFACPQKCNSCMANGMHACGNPAMKNVSIVIATH